MTVTIIILELIFSHSSQSRALLRFKVNLDAKKNPEQVSKKAEIKFAWSLIAHPLNGPPPPGGNDVFQIKGSSCPLLPS